MKPEDFVTLRSKHIRHNGIDYRVVFTMDKLKLYKKKDTINFGTTPTTIQYNHDFVYSFETKAVLDRVRQKRTSESYIKDIVEIFFNMYLEDRETEQEKSMKEKQIIYFDKWSGYIE